MDARGELDLVKRAQEGDRDAYGRLVDLYGGIVLGIAYSRVGNYAVSQDIAQDALVLGFEHVESLRRPQSFGAWLKTITANLCNRWLRSRVYRNRLHEDSAALRERLGYDAGASADERLENKELRSMIDEMVAKLPVRDREALVLFYFKDRSIKEAADAAGITTDAMKKRLERARKRLRDALTDRVETELVEAGRARPTSARVLAAIPLGASIAKVAPVAAVLPSAHMLSLTGLLGKTGGFVMGTGKSAGIVVAVCVALLAAGGLYIARERGPAEQTVLPEAELVRSASVPEETTGPFAPTGPETSERVLPVRREVASLPEGAPVESGPGAQHVSDDSGKQTEEKDVQQIGAVVSGRVTDSDMNPIEGAELTANHLSAGAGVVRSHADGSYRLNDLRRNVAYRIKASARGYGRVAKPVAVPGTGDVTGVDFVLESGSTVAGYVVDTDGNLIAGAQVLMYANLAGASGATDSRGQFHIQDVAPGTYRFSVEMGLRYQSAVNEPLIVAAGESITGLEVVVEVGHGTVEGLAVDKEGHGVAGVDVSVSSLDGMARGQTDAEGYYRLDGLGKHAVEINFRHPEYAHAFLTNIPVGTVDADVVMFRDGIISGVVLDATTLEPVRDFTIEIATNYQNPDGVWFENQDSHSFGSAAGEFVIEDVQPGAATLKTIASGYVPQEISGVMVASGEVTSGIEVRLTPGNVVRGVVVAASDSQPVAGAKVYLGGIPDFMAEGQTLKVITAADGSFVLAEVPAGEQVLGAKHPDYAPTSVPLTVYKGEVTEVTIELRTGGMIAGHVTENERPFSGAYVMLSRGPRLIGQLSAHTDANGYYEFDGLTTGTYRVIASLPSEVGVSGGGPLLSSRTAVEEGLVAEQDFDFKSGTGVIEGYVLKDGEPISGIDASILVMYTSGGVRIAGRSSVDETGFYRVTGLAPDSYRVSVSANFTTSRGNSEGRSRTQGGAATIGMASVQLDDDEAVQVDIETADNASDE